MTSARLISALALWLCCSAASWSQEPSPPEDPASRPREIDEATARFVKEFVEAKRLDEDLKFRDKQAARFATRAPLNVLSDALRGIQSGDRKRVLEMLAANADALESGLRETAKRYAAEENRLQEGWKSVRIALNKSRAAKYEADSGSRVAGQIAYLLSVENRWFWLGGVLLIATLAGVAFHERRHEIRRRLHGARARAMGLSYIMVALVVVFALVTLAMFVSGDRIYRSLVKLGTGAEPPHEQILREEAEMMKAVQSDAKNEGGPPEDKYEQTLEEIKARSPDPALATRCLKILDEVRQIAVSAEVQKELADRVVHDGEQLSEVQDQIAKEQGLTAARYRKVDGIRAGFGIAVLAVAIGGTAVFQRGVRLRRERTRNTCPRCLGEYTLESVSDAHGPRDMVRCLNENPAFPLGVCDFTFSEIYREMTKLCFPTLGVPASGKTFWSVMMYRQVNRGDYPGRIRFARIRSGAAEEFDRILSEILVSRMNPAATQTERIPPPIMFNFRDRDFLGKSNVLVHVFDYSGEVVRNKTLADFQRQRALDGEGFLFFLDPTAGSDEQSQALIDFREDLLELKRSQGGGLASEIRTPVALCVSKIDLLVAQPYADQQGGGEIGKFYDDLAEIDWQEASLAAIEARSKLVAGLRETIWPGWHIERQVQELFGGRHMFFPMTPVGLDRLGETNLANRVIAPVGLLEPLVWLMHMNGYRVL